jgi:hypothetical protein
MHWSNNTDSRQVIWLKMLLSNGVNPATNATVVPASVLETVTTGITVWPFGEDSYVVFRGGLNQLMRVSLVIQNFLRLRTEPVNTKAAIGAMVRRRCYHSEPI